MVAIVGLRKEQILGAVRKMYSEVATAPARPFHFPTGREACRFVGYPDSWLETLPEAALESFAGVGFPFRADVIREGDRVLDIGAGSGTDALIAARLVGPRGRVMALDVTPAMLAKLRDNAALAGAENVQVIGGNVEAIPLPDASVDVVTSNGVLNLVPDKRAAFAEIWRVLRPGGRVQLADVVISRVVSDTARKDPKLWAECVVGAVVEEDYLDLFRAQGFAEVTVLRRYDYFAGSRSSETRTLARALGAQAAEITTRKPSRSRSLLTQLQRLRPAALARRAGQHGVVGLIASVAALVACYGVLALVAGLALLGVSLPVDTRMWTAAIVTLTVLAPFGLAWNFRAHRHLAPILIGAAGALLVLYALLFAYDWRVEAAGFLALLGAALWDRQLFRYVC